MRQTKKQENKKTILRTCAFVLPARITALAVGGLLSCFIAFLPLLTYAQDTNDSGLKKPQLQINIPTLQFSDQAGNWTGEYIAAIYKYAVGVVGIVAAVVMMFGGVLWLTSGGDSGKVSEAKEWIKASLLGLILALGSYTILYVVNPALVSFSSLNINKIQETAVPTETETVPIAEDRIPVGVNPGRYTHAQAQQQLNSAITVKPGASLNNVRTTTIDGINAFQEQFDGNLTITSGTDGAHQPGTYSHSEGYKLDLRTSDNAPLLAYIRNEGQSVNRVAGFDAYTMTINSYDYRFLIEPNHIDVRIIPH